VILRLVWENIRFRPMRTLLSILLIGVPVMLILTLVGVSRGFMEDSRQRTRGVGADIIFRPPNSSFTSGATSPIPQGAVATLAKVPHVAMATGVAQALVGKLFNAINGIDYPAFKRMSGGFTFIEGDEAHAFQEPGDLVVDTNYAAEQHPKLHAGDKFQLLNRTWRVTGVVETGKLGHVFASLPDLQQYNGTEGKVSQIYLKLDNPANTEAVLADLKNRFPEYSIYSVKEWVDLTSVDQIPAVGIFVNVIIGIGVFTGLFVVSLSMYMAVLQRTREIGILKSLGATKGFVMTLILWEAAFMGVGGTIAGIVLSFGSRAALQNFVPASLPQAIVPSWWPIVLGIALGSAILGAVYPGMIAVRQDPIEALSYE
jgi:putative ABC transport system permease protein